MKKKKARDQIATFVPIYILYIKRVERPTRVFASATACSVYHALLT